MQRQFQPLSVAEQILELLALTEGYFDTIPVATFQEAEAALLVASTELPADVMQRLVSAKTLSEADKVTILALAKKALLPFATAANESKKIDSVHKNDQS